MPMNYKTDRIYVAGHRGMVGSALVRALQERGANELILPSRDELDLGVQSDVSHFIREEKPDLVIIAAARVGGILANAEYPWEFLYENLLIETNLIGAAHQNNIPKLVFLGSSCIYPKYAPQPLREDTLLTGSLEPTNEAYAIAKIAGLKLCEALHKQYGRSYFSLMPTNLYGPNDNFDTLSSHVIPAMIRKFHDALPDKPVHLWGSGSAMREFLHVDDLAQAVLFTLEKDHSHTLINVGTGMDLSIKELAFTIQSITGHVGPIQWDTSKPDGTPRKCLDVSRLNQLGWYSRIGLEDGLRDTYHWFKQHQKIYKTVHFGK
jgi:GDP-L-fucose synthase